MLITPRECSQLGRNSCTSAYTSIAVEPSNSSASSTSALWDRAACFEWTRVESGAEAVAGAGSEDGGGVTAAATTGIAGAGAAATAGATGAVPYTTVPA